MKLFFSKSKMCYVETLKQSDDSMATSHYRYLLYYHSPLLK